MNDRDADGLCLFRSQILIFRSEDRHRPAVLRIDAAQNLHQCGFPRSVLSEKCHDLTGTEFKIHMIQGFYARKCLDDVFH